MSHPRKAFTLIELLVVVAIIALLISMLLPSLSKARETARIVACLSIHKQMGTANIMYADANDNWYVRFNGNPKHLSIDGGGFWGSNITFRQMLGLQSVPKVAGVAGTGYTAISGLIDPSKPSSYIEDGLWYRSFAWNAMGTAGHPGEGLNGAVNRARVVIPSTKVLGMDAANWYLSGSTQTDPVHWDTLGDDWPSGKAIMAYRHLDKTNMVMHDGHAATFGRDEAYKPSHPYRITLYGPYNY